MHPVLDALWLVADGDNDAIRTHSSHVFNCAHCRKELSLMRALSGAIGEVILESRPGCPSTDELALMTSREVLSDPHVANCHLCRTELEMREFLRRPDEDRNVAFSFDSAALRNPSEVTTSMFQAASSEAVVPHFADQIEIQLVEGESASGVVAGVTVSLLVEEGRTLRVTLAAAPVSPLVLALQHPEVTKRILIRNLVSTIPIGRWVRALVTPAKTP